VGRYSLKVGFNNLPSVIIDIPENGKLKEKTSLMAIDSYTIGKEPSYLLKTLDFNQAIINNKTKLYISYISNGYEKRLDPIFNNSHDLKSISDNNERKINIKNSKFLNFMNNVFLPLLEDPRFIVFLKGKNFLTLKLSEWINNYLYNEYENEFCYFKILEYASNYKQFRSLIIGVELYNNPNYLKQSIVKYEKPNYERFVLSKMNDEIDPDEQFGLYSEEELRKYADYMDSLPSEFDCHSKTL